MKRALEWCLNVTLVGVTFMLAINLYVWVVTADWGFLTTFEHFVYQLRDFAISFTVIALVGFVNGAAIWLCWKMALFLIFLYRSFRDEWTRNL